MQNLKPLFIAFLIYGLTFFISLFVLKMEMLFVGLIAFLTSILYYHSKNLAKLKKLTKEANTDCLTEVYNQRFFNNTIKEEIFGKPKGKNQFSILLIDLDDFKEINDTYGHVFGNTVLKEAGKILMENTRKDDAVVRYGGDEFVILLPDTDEEKAIRVAKKIEEVFDSKSIPTPKKDRIRIKVSIGMAVFPKDGTDLESLLEEADARMYSKKAKKFDMPVS
jgi:diguanylate cyclase (GGDEF)-like protein